MAFSRRLNFFLQMHVLQIGALIHQPTHKKHFQINAISTFFVHVHYMHHQAIESLLAHCFSSCNSSGDEEH